MLKKENKFTFIVLTILVAVFSFLQFFEISFFGAKPNFAAVGIVIASFFIFDFFEGVFLSTLSIFLLKFSPGNEQELIIFFVLSILAMFVGRKMPWEIYLSFFILTILFSLLFYAFISPISILSQIFFKELVYNVLIGLGIIAILQQFVAFKE